MPEERDAETIYASVRYLRFGCNPTLRNAHERSPPIGGANWESTKQTGKHPTNTICGRTIINSIKTQAHNHSLDTIHICCKYIAPQQAQKNNN